MLKILPLSENTASENMRFDEDLLAKRARGDIPNTLRFYTWNPRAISVGFSQKIEDEVNLDVAKEFGVDVVQRVTGGGAVLHDDEITYSIVLSEKDVPMDVIESYKVICSVLVSALRSLGLNAEHKPINDVVIDGRKVSGSAQTRKNGVVLQHGTILLGVDDDFMRQILKKPKFDKYGITSLKEYGSFTKEQVVSALEKAFKEQFR